MADEEYIWSVLTVSVATLLGIVFLTQSIWSRWYIKLVMWSSRGPSVRSKPLPVEPLGVDGADKYDEISYLCANSTDRSFLHVEITRKPDRKSHVKFTLCVRGELTYELPSRVVTYNNSPNGFSAAGLTITQLEDEKRWRLSYSGPLLSRRCGLGIEQLAETSAKSQHIKLVLLWKIHSALLDPSVCEYTHRSLQQYFLKLYTDKRITTGDIKAFMTERRACSEQSRVQAGAMQGYIQVSSGEEESLALRGFKRRSFGEMAPSDGTVSFVEQVLVSKKGHLQYIRIPQPTDSRPHTRSELSKLCSVKMYPNGELIEADLDLIYPYMTGWQSNVPTSATDRHGIQTEVKPVGIDSAYIYNITDSIHGIRSCLLVPMACVQKHPLITQKDEGLGFLLYSNVSSAIEERSEGHVALRSLQMKDLVPYEKFTSRKLLRPVSYKRSGPQADELLAIGLDHPDCVNEKDVGGKGSCLAVLYQATQCEDDTMNQFCVPLGICVKIEAFRLQLEANPELLELSAQLELTVDAEVSMVKDLCERLRDGFMTSDVNPQTKYSIRELLEGAQYETEFGSETRFAVRSSAIGEDGVDMSAAGQMDTILGVKGYTNILQALRQCWASHFTFQAVQYKRQHGQLINGGMAVVIQKMVNAEQAGVLFTYDPVNGDCSTMVINANFGVGESVVSGETDPDTIRITRSYDSSKDSSNYSSADVTFNIRDKHIGSKSVQHLVTDAGDISQKSVAQSRVLCLNDESILSLCKIGLEIEQSFGYPCDIEWAIYERQIHILQSRPITTLNKETEYELLHEFDSPLVRDDEMLSTMNIGEVMPGALCPLTLSTTIPSLEGAMQSLNTTYGLNYEPEVQRLTKTYCNTLFLNVHAIEISHKGRDHIANRRMMELALAGHTIDKMTNGEVESYHHSVSLFQRFLNSIKFIQCYWGGYKQCIAHQATVDALQTPDTTDCTEIVTYIEHALTVLDQVFIDDLPAAGGSAICCQIIIGMLTKGAEVYETKHYSDLAVLLGCQLTEIHSAGVPEKLEALSGLIKGSGDLSHRFCDIPPSEGHDLLTANSTPSNVRQAYLYFMSEYGHRGIRELDIMEKCWAQNPAEVVETLQMMVRHSSTERTTQPSTSSVEDVINSLQCKISDGEKRFLRWFLPKTKKAVDNREVCKSLLVKAVCKVKLAYWTLAELMCKQGYLPFAEVLFFLTHTEVCLVLQTRNGSLINRAKRRYRVYKKQNDMKFPRFNDGKPKPIGMGPGNDHSIEVEVELKGMPVSIGEVTGTARVIKSLSQAHLIQKNDIMVVQYTDVGWAPFFPLISGVVTEQGGLVSHGAVVAREYGIPCVASCPNATDVLRSGDLVCLNGTTGVVRRLKVEVQM